MDISVIIPTYNEEDVVLKCLKSLDTQKLKSSKFEVIVIDDGSTDNTFNIVKSYSPKKYRLILLKGEHKGPGYARNLGAKSAIGKVLVFVDSDMTFDVHFLKNLTEPILKNLTKGTFSKDEIVSNWEKPFARCYSLNEGWEKKKRHPKKYPDTQKVFRAILKSEFDKVGGFTPGGYNDDWSLSEKLGYEATMVDNAIFYHKNPDNLKEIYLHAVWVGKRKYKLGALGYVAALIRSSLPISLVVGLFKSFIYAVPQFLIFKVVYDFGLFVGVLKYILTKQGSK